MSLIRISKRRRNNKIPKSEFKITSQLLYCFDAEIDEGYNIIVNYIPLTCGDKELAYSEHYSSLNTEIPKNKMIFRPIKNERHSNILIEMFEQSLIDISIERLEIEEYVNKNGKKRYSGYFVCKNNYNKDSIMTNTEVKGLPSIAALKTAIVAKAMLDENDFYDFMTLLKELVFNGE